MPTLKLTLANIKSKCLPPPDGAVTKTGMPVLQAIYWDTDVKGLGLVVWRPRPGHDGINASWVLQREVSGRVTKETLGRFGPWTPHGHGPGSGSSRWTRASSPASSSPRESP